MKWDEMSCLVCTFVTTRNTVIGDNTENLAVDIRESSFNMKCGAGGGGVGYEDTESFS